MRRPTPSEYSDYYKPFIEKIEAQNLTDAMREADAAIQNIRPLISEYQGNFRYAPDKWSIKEILQHLIDADRVFAYRALCIARGDSTVLPGFDHHLYVQNCNADYRTVQSLFDELIIVRKGHAVMAQSFSNSMLDRVGQVMKTEMSPLVIGFIQSGHIKHHLKVIEEKYLTATSS